MKKISKIVGSKAFNIIAVVIAVLVAFGGGYGFFHARSLVTKGGGISWQEIKEISELSTLEYRYEDVDTIDEQKEFKLFGLWDIHPGESFLIVKYKGVIKLGIDCSELQIEESLPEDGKKQLKIKLPPIKILSSGTPTDGSEPYEVLVDKGVMTSSKVSVSDFLQLRAEREEEIKNSILESEAADAALINAKNQLASLLNAIPGVQGEYEIVWE